MRDVLERLLTISADQVITITAPLDRHRPGNDEDRIRLRNLVASAHKQVHAAMDPRAARALVDRLDAAVDEVAFDRGALGCVVVATADMSESHLLRFPVAPSLSIDGTPATRYLVQGLKRSPRFRVLTVSDHTARLFEAVRDDLFEVRDHGFPLVNDAIPRDRRAVAGKFALAPGADDKEPRRNFFREVDRALSTASDGDELPVVLAGVTASLSLFGEVARNDLDVIGHIDGSHDRTNAHDLGREAWPFLREHLKARRVKVVEEVAESLHTGKSVSGIDEAWQLAREGRGRLLVVEEDYAAAPAHEIDGRLVASDEADAMADPVDELIEHMVRTGGSVEFVGPNAMEDLGHIGLVLR